MIIAGVALGAVAERRQPDRHPRLRIDRKGELEIAGRHVAVDVADVSAGGCSVGLPHDEALAALAHDTRGALRVVAIGPHAGDDALPLMLRRVEDDGKTLRLAFEFPELQGREYYVLADLMYGDSDALPRFLMSRRAHKDILRGSAQFVRWGLFEPLRSFAYLLAETRVALASRRAASGEAAGEAAAAPAPALAAPAAAPPANVAAPVAQPVAPRSAEPREVAAAAPVVLEEARRRAARTIDDAHVSAGSAKSVSGKSVSARTAAAPAAEAAPPSAADPAEDAISSLRRLLDRAQARTPGARTRAA
jgi:cellulose synthase (UDP-forming)